MGLLSSMIVTVCMGTQGNINSACNASLNATASYTGIDRNFNRFEDETKYKADSYATSFLGPDGKRITGSMLFVFQTAANQTLVVPIPTGGYADSFNTEFRPDRVFVSIRWNFL